MPTRAYKLAPNNPAILDTYGVLLADRGEVRRGVEMLQKAVALAPPAREFVSIWLVR
jgi:Tfp pilus assembly protein PilF